MSTLSLRADRPERIHFPNLNGARCLAAFVVVVHHLEQLKEAFHMDTFWYRYAGIRAMGKLGVVFFFVLSGFLITYLLLTEEQRKGRIDVARFYLRRIVRIWPLYFLLIILAFAVFPHIGFFTLPGYGRDLVYQGWIGKVVLYALFLPNVVLAYIGVVPYASHTWSIGTEEQFYFLWPLLLLAFRRRRLLAMVAVIVGYILIAHTDLVFGSPKGQLFWSMFNIECMAIGGILAVLLFRKSPLLRLLHHPLLFHGVLVTTLVLVAFGVHNRWINVQTYAGLFGILILNLASNPAIRLSLEHPVLDRLGRISYGLYMYHPIAIVLVLQLARGTGLQSDLWIYPLTFGLTIAMAALSYRYFESYFLRIKDRFALVPSGDDRPIGHPADDQLPPAPRSTAADGR